jgi:peptidyl-prolyl cis-trans isomerase D
VDKRLLQEIEGNESFLEFARRSGVKPADRLVADILQNDPKFLGPVTGRFDEKVYQDWLNKIANLNGMSKASMATNYEGFLRDQITQTQLDAGLAAGLHAPLVFGALRAAYAQEGRNVTFFKLTEQNLPPIPPPSDAELQAFVKKYVAMLPEMRTLTIVRFSAKALAPSLPVDEAAVRKAFDFKKDANSTPEKRSLIQIQTKDAGVAAAVVKRLKAGEPAAAVAKSVGAQPITYTDSIKGGIADPKVADVAFALKTGEVSAPIQTSLTNGYAVVVVQSITPAKAADFEAMRPALEAQARADSAAQKTYDQSTKFSNLHSGGMSLADAAKAAGATPVTVGPITADGMTVLGQPVAGLSPKLMKDAFNLAQNGESDVEEDSAGEYFIVHVDKITPPALPSIQDPAIKQKLIQEYGRREIMNHLQALSTDMVQRIRKGERLETVAASVGAKVEHAATSRYVVFQSRSLSREIMGKMFSAKPGEVFSGLLPEGAAMVARVESITPASPVQTAPMTLQMSQGLSRALFEDMGEAVRTAAIASVKPKVYPDHALTAIGAAPGQASKLAGAAPKGPAQ